ncbi:DUF58 domain-containing protein [Salibacterium sp. K-3]
MTDSDLGYRTHDHRPQSLFFADYMGWVLLVFIGTALWFQIIPLIAISAFLYILHLFIHFWKKSIWNGISPALHLPRTRVFNGGTFTAHASLSNKKWLPITWVEWEQWTDSGIQWKESTEHSFRLRVLWLLQYQQVSWDMEGTAVRRGVYSIGDIHLHSGDPFRFTEEMKTWHLNRVLYVYPALLSVTPPALSASMSWEMKGTHGGFIEDPLLIQGIREYEAGDEWSRIDQRATARTGSWKTRIFQPVMTKEWYGVLDMTGFREDDNSIPSDPLEKVLSIMASTALYYNRRNIHTGQIMNALNHNTLLLPPIPAQKNATPFLDNLAKLIPHAGMSSLRLLEEVSRRVQSGSPVYVFCDTVSETHFRWFQSQRKDRHRLTFYYLHESKWARQLGHSAQPVEGLMSEQEEEP